MKILTKADLQIVNELSKRAYSGNTIVSNASEDEKANLKKVKIKLKEMAEFFNQKYSNNYGPFENGVVTGNDIAMGGTKLKTMWSGIYKGTHKQYGAQISFVIDKNKPLLHVGFYFGRANARQIQKIERDKLESQLDDLAINLSTLLKNDNVLKESYDSLFELGFKAFTEEELTTSNDWIGAIVNNAKTSQIVIKISPDEFGSIDYKMIDCYVSQLMFLMNSVDKHEIKKQRKKPLTPEQRAKQAERLCLIGYKGEVYVMEEEKKKLDDLGIKKSGYPRHVSLESDSFGYDVLSLDENGKEIYIEVKTTTRSKDDLMSKSFYFSKHEHKTCLANIDKYKLHRVFDVENDPSWTELNFDQINMETNSYYCTFL